MFKYPEVNEKSTLELCNKIFYVRHNKFNEDEFKVLFDEIISFAVPPYFEWEKQGKNNKEYKPSLINKDMCVSCKADEEIHTLMQDLYATLSKLAPGATSEKLAYEAYKRSKVIAESLTKIGQARVMRLYPNPEVPELLHKIMNRS